MNNHKYFDIFLEYCIAWSNVLDTVLMPVPDQSGLGSGMGWAHSMLARTNTLKGFEHLKP